MMSISKPLIGAAALFMAVSSSLHAAPISSWNFNGVSNFGPSSLSATNSVSGITATLTRGPGLETTGTPSANAYGGSGISTFASAQSATAQAAAIAAGDYFLFSLEAAEGVTFSLDSIDSYYLAKSVPSGANIYLFWQYSVDGTNFSLFSQPTPVSGTSTGAGKGAVNLSNTAALQDIDSVQIRFGFYGQNALPTAATGLSFRNYSGTDLPFSISGSVVPEPSTYALIALGGIALAVGYLRKRKSAATAA